MQRRALQLVLAASTLCGLFSACASTESQRRPEARQAQQLFRLAQVDFAEGKNQEAILHLKQSIEIDPRNADVHNYLGVVYLLLSDFEKSERELEEALRLNPYLTDARVALGVVSMKTHRPDRARSFFEEALKDQTYQSPEKIHYNLGSLELDENRPAEAMESFRKALAARPGYPQGLLGLGRALAASGRREDARIQFEKVIALDPKSPEAAEARQLLAKLPRGGKG